MDVVRRFSLLATTGLLGVAVLLGWVSARPSLSASSATQLTSATRWFDSTIVLARLSRPTGPRGDQLTIGLGYLERLRVGAESPFRLIDQALHDPRNDSASNRRVAWALLGRLRRGDAYVVDPIIFEGAGPWSPGGHGATGAAHLALIAKAIADAPDPRAGELAVRLAYMIEAAKSTIAASAPEIAAQVAALYRDRALAQEDLRELVADAVSRHENVLALLVMRRGSREFRVEEPSMLPLSPELQTAAMNDVPALVAQLDTLDRVTNATRPEGLAPVLGPQFAERLAVLGALQPTVAQVVVTLKGQARATLAATNEETLIAGSALIRATAGPDRANAIALLAGVVALRPYNQELPWFVGSPAPGVSDLAAEFGLASVTFARSVPAAWRPYYLRELRDGLRDMQQVLPALSVVGLNVAFGTSDLPDSALAMHDPRTRTLQLAVGTSAGTLAHELAHDLDWQTSRRLFARAGGYSTDRAIREHRGALAASVRGLAEARSTRPRPDASREDEAIPDRPAELFARGVDWFTASSLANLGRMNGFLSAVQDPTLPGYAAGAPAAVGANGTTSLISALEQMTYVRDSVQAAFDGAWADAATIDPVVLVRRVLSTMPQRGMFTVRTTVPGTMPGAMLGSQLPALTSRLCMLSGTSEGRARERLAMLAIHARARGIVARRARYRFPGAPPADWSNGLFGVPPWNAAPADRMVASVERSLISELRAASDPGIVAAIPARFASTDDACPALAR